MKRLAILLAAPLLLTTPAQAKDMDACGAILCLAGLMAGGDGGGACASYIASYFSIVKFKHGVPNPVRTAQARMKFLDACDSGDAATSRTARAVNGRYGRLFFGLF